MLANAGHLPWEIDVAGLYGYATARTVLDEAIERVATRAASLVPGAQPVPDAIDRDIARRMLAVMGADQ